MGNHGFKKGNQLWRLAKKPVGPPRLYDADKLWDKFVEYMEENEKTAWDRDDFIKSGPDAGKIVSVKIPNAPSIRMFCIFAEITEQTLIFYEKKEEMTQVVQAVKGIIQEIQLGGAVTNIYNSNIVARWVGLTDKKEIDLRSDLSDDERKNMINEIMEKMRR